HGTDWHLGSRQIHLGRVFILERPVFHVSNNTDDLPNLFGIIVGGEARGDSLADHVLAGEKPGGKTLVHNHNRRRFELIRLVENAPPFQWDAHSLEIVGTDDADW